MTTNEIIRVLKDENADKDTRDAADGVQYKGLDASKRRN